MPCAITHRHATTTAGATLESPIPAALIAMCLHAPQPLLVQLRERTADLCGTDAQICGAVAAHQAIIVAAAAYAHFHAFQLPVHP
jgi:hypothetical protein